MASPLLKLLKEHFKEYRGPLLIGALSIIAVDSAELALPVVIKWVIDSFSDGSTRQILPRVMAALVVIVSIQVSARYVWRLAIVKSSMKRGATLRQDLSSKLFAVPISFYDRRKVGDLMTLATSDIENMRMALAPAIIMLVDAVFYGITIPMAMFYVSPELSWKSLIPAILIPFAVIKLQGKIAQISGEVQSTIGRLSVATQDAIAGIRLVRIFSAEQPISSKLQRISRELNQKQVSLARTQAAMGPALELVLSISLMIVLSSGLTLSVGTLVALQRYLQKLMWPLSALGLAVVILQKAKQSAIGYYEVLNETSEGKSHGTDQDWATKETLSDSKILEVKHLNFAFGDTKILQDVNFEVKAGEWLGIQGDVGSGKSTLLSLLLKFYDTSPGAIAFEGLDLTEWDPIQLRSRIATVMQDPYLFQGTILTNLEVGEEISAKEALSLVELEIGDSRDSELGDRGVGLSGGQKQRLAIARALRRKSSLVLLDDPLSSVDPLTAKNVLQKLKVHLKGSHQTVIYFSHHEEHLSYCDRVLSLSSSKRSE